MTAPLIDPDEQDPLLLGVRRHQRRMARFDGEHAPSVVRRLGEIGVLGWLIVVPMLIGLFAGRWLDRRFHAGLFCTAPLLMLGLALGCWSAWRWVKSA